MKVFVTGGSGLLGSAVVRALLGRRHHVVAVVRATSHRTDLDALGVDVHVCELDDIHELERRMAGCLGLCHVAGAAGRFYVDPDHYERTNVVATTTVFRAARCAGIARAVYTGTVADVWGLGNAYARSKRDGVRAARSAAGHAMDVMVVHPSGMIGPYDRTPTPLGRAIQRFAEGGMRAVAGGGSGYIHVDDAAAGHVAALETGDPKREYVLDAGYWKTRDLFASLAAITGQTPPLVIPIAVADLLARFA